MDKVLVLLAPGFEEIEAVTIIDILRRAEIEVTVAALNADLVTGSHKITIKPDVYYHDVDESLYTLLVLPGGQPGSTNLKNNPLIRKWIQRRKKQGRLNAAICAAPTVFAAAGVAGNLKITSYPAEAGQFKESTYVELDVVEDGGLITSRAVGTAIPFALYLVSRLKGKALAEEIRTKILYPLPLVELND